MGRRKKGRREKIDFQHGKKSPFMLPWCCLHYLGAMQSVHIFPLVCESEKESLIYGQHFVPHDVHFSCPHTTIQLLHQIQLYISVVLKSILFSNHNTHLITNISIDHVFSIALEQLWACNDDHFFRVSNFNF